MKSILIIRGEWRKLLNPVVISLFVVALGFLWSDLKTTVYLARLQPAVAVASGADSSQLGSDSTTASLNENFVRNALVLGAVGQSLGSLAGLSRFAANQLGTGLGWLLVAALAALQVSGEVSRRTFDLTRRSAGSLRRATVAKVLGIWGSVSALLVVVPVALFAAKPLFFHPVRVPDPPIQGGPMSQWSMVTMSPSRDWAGLLSALRAMLIASVSLLLAAVLFVAIGLLVGRTLMALAVNAVIVFGMFLTSQALKHPGLTPERTVAKLLGLGSTFGVFDTRAWDRGGRPTEIGFPTVHASAAGWAIVGWAVAIIGSAAVAFSVTRRARRL